MSRRKRGGKRPNAGRPRNGRVNLVVRVRPEVAALIDSLAFQNLMTRGEIVELQFAQKHAFTPGA
jgi:hypothetical protein